MPTLFPFAEIWVVSLSGLEAYKLDAFQMKNKPEAKFQEQTQCTLAANRHTVHWNCQELLGNISPPQM